MSLIFVERDKPVLRVRVRTQRSRGWPVDLPISVCPTTVRVVNSGILTPRSLTDLNFHR